jgi:hypothetical protein
MTATAHNCEVCGKMIPTASRALNAHGRIWGFWFNEYFHIPECAQERIDSIPDEALRAKLNHEMKNRTVQLRKSPSL